MGNSNEEKRIRNNHAEEIARIEAMNEENERQAAIKRLALENGYKLDLKRIQNYADEARMRHEEILRELEYKRQHEKDLVDAQRRRDEMLDRREREKIAKEHEKSVRELQIKEDESRRADIRLTEEMRKKHELNIKKQSDDYLLKKQKLDDDKELAKIHEEHRHDEKKAEIESKKEVELKKCEIQKLEVEERKQKNELDSKERLATMGYKHNENIEEMKRLSKKDDHNQEINILTLQTTNETTNKKLEQDYNITMKKMDNEHDLKLLELQIKMKELELKKEKQNETPQNINQMAAPQPQPFLSNQIPYSYNNNYYSMHLYQNPINDRRQYEKVNGYPNQNPYWNQNPPQMNPSYYATPIPQQIYQNPYPMNYQNIPPIEVSQSG